MILYYGASTVFTAPKTGVYNVLLQGGGGGGQGYSDGTGVNGSIYSGGGGGSGYVVIGSVILTKGQQVPITIGSGGVGGGQTTATVNVGEKGQDGYPTSFGTYFTALGGNGGGNVLQPNDSVGGAGMTPGQAGKLTIGSLTMAGKGGDGYMIGQGNVSDGSNGANTTMTYATAGNGNGCGGSGGFCIPASGTIPAVNHAGDNGFRGIFYIMWHNYDTNDVDINNPLLDWDNKHEISFVPQYLTYYDFTTLATPYDTTTGIVNTTIPMYSKNYSITVPISMVRNNANIAPNNALSSIPSPYTILNGNVLVCHTVAPYHIRGEFINATLTPSGTNYVITGEWILYDMDVIVNPNQTDAFTVFQSWNNTLNYDTYNKIRLLSLPKPTPPTPVYDVWGWSMNTATGAVTYTDKAIGMGTGSAWDTTPLFSGIHGCVFKNGQLVMYLDDNNDRLRTDGILIDTTDSDIGDIMVEIPLFGIKLNIDNSNPINLNCQITNQPGVAGYDYSAFMKPDGTYANYMYVGRYQGSTSTKQMGLWSLGGVGTYTPILETNVPLTTFQNGAYLKAPNYTILSYQMMSFIRAMFVLRQCSVDSRSSFGSGIMSTSGYYQPGVYTPDNGSSMYGVNTYSGRVRFMGIEDLWGNTQTLLQGFAINDSGNMYVSKDNRPGIPGSADYIDTGLVLSGSVQGYPTTFFENSSQKFNFIASGANTASVTNIPNSFNLKSSVIAGVQSMFVSGGYFGSGVGGGIFTMFSIEKDTWSNAGMVQNITARICYV